jgi:REP element-mobilizing transposase RayT
MPTHYHFLVRIQESAEEKTSEVSETSEVSGEDISKAMMRFSVSYTKAINERFDRVGALFQGAYRAKRVPEESYLVSLSRYVHRNPVSAGLVERPAAWPFSSYRDFVGERAGHVPCPGVVLDAFASRNAYRRFVEERPQQGTEGDEWRNVLFEDEQDTG